MIRITRQADYGIVLLTCFAQAQGSSPKTARDVAAEAHLPLPMVMKILKVLARAGLLASHRGAHGGYTLALPPDAISVADVIGALEGPIGMTECTSPGPESCSIAAECAVKTNWQTLNRVVRDALARISLAQMAGPLRPVAPRAPGAPGRAAQDRPLPAARGS